MNPNDIANWAVEAFDPLSDWRVDIFEFAKLVAAAEREACARIVDAAQPFGHIAATAAAIRARGKA